MICLHNRKLASANELYNVLVSVKNKFLNGAIKQTNYEV